MVKKKQNTTTFERALTRPAQKVGKKYMNVFGSAKAVLSAGVMALDLLTAEQRELAVSQANAEQDENSEPADADLAGAARVLIRFADRNGVSSVLRFLSKHEIRLFEQFQAALGPSQAQQAILDDVAAQDAAEAAQHKPRRRSSKTG